MLRSVPHSANSCSEKYIMWRFKVNEDKDDILMAAAGFILLVSIIFLKETFFGMGGKLNKLNSNVAANQICTFAL